MTKRVLITGATGNIGFEVIRFLYSIKTKCEIVAGVRNIEKAKHLFKDFPLLGFQLFDFEQPDTFDKLENFDLVFLLRPPHIANVDVVFKPFLQKSKKQNVKQIVFLSVQGAEKSKIIPHNKIESLIKELGFDFIFLRPSYFMQNLTTSLYNEIKHARRITLPAGRAKFNWVDVENIGEVAAVLISQFEKYKNHSFEITGYENKSFQEALNVINDTLCQKIEYRSVNPFSFFRIKSKEGISKGMIIVMIMLHFLPRFQKVPKVSDCYEKLTGKKPLSLREFAIKEKDKFL